MTLDLTRLDRLSRECIHCGLCLESCPTYGELRAEPDSPRGRLHLIKALIDGQVPASPEYFGPLDRCVGCRACESACPSAVEYGHLLEHARERFVRPNRPAAGRRLAWQTMLDHLLTHPRRLRRVLAPLRGVQRLWPDRTERLYRGLPGQLARLVEMLGPAGPVDRPLPEFTPAQNTRRGQVGLLTGCVMDALYRPVHEATIRMLAVAGFDVWVPPQQGCCGALHRHEGDMARAGRLETGVMAAFGSGTPRLAALEAVVTNSAGCGASLKDLARADQPDASRAFGTKVRDVSEFLAEVGLPPAPQRLERRVVYHDPCHLAHGQKVREAPRRLLESVPGLELVPLTESDWCCGGAGAFTVLQPEMSDRLLERKLRHLVASGASWVVTGNPSCLMQIGMGLRRDGLPMRLLHTVQLLDAVWSEKQTLG